MFHDIDLKKIRDNRYNRTFVMLTSLGNQVSTVTVVILVLKSRISVAWAVAAEFLGYF